MNNAIEDFFIRQNKHNNERKYMLMKWKKHHEYCLKKIAEEMQEIDLLPTCYNDFLEERRQTDE